MLTVRGVVARGALCDLVEEVSLIEVALLVKGLERDVVGQALLEPARLELALGVRDERVPVPQVERLVCDEELGALIERGVLLELTPDSLDDLPDAQTLREIADALGGDGIRYVSLLIGSRDPS